MSPGEPLLIVSHTFPPYRGIGGRRWAKFAKAFARKGHQVHVIHSAGDPSLIGSLWNDDIKHPNIVCHALPQRYPTVLFKRPLPSFGEKVAYRFWSRALPLMVKGNWYDKSVFWHRQLLHKAMQLIDRHGIRNVIVSGAPFRLMAHLVELKTLRPQCRLIADFRDPWSWGDVYGHGTLSAERRRYELELESRVVRNFDRVISPAPAIIEHLRSAYALAAGRAVHVPHAVDPDETGAPLPARNDGLFKMIYAGSLYGAGEAERYFDHLLAAFRMARSAHPEALARSSFDLYVTGHDVSTYQARVAAAGLENTIRFHPARPAKELFPIIAKADLVPIFIPTANKDFLGTKFNEIFHLKRPVLHIGAPGLVSRTIEENHLGASIGVDDLERVIPALIAGERVISVAPGHDVRPHLLDSITDRLSSEVLA